LGRRQNGFCGRSGCARVHGCERAGPYIRPADQEARRTGCPGNCFSVAIYFLGSTPGMGAEREPQARLEGVVVSEPGGAAGLPVNATVLGFHVASHERSVPLAAVEYSTYVLGCQVMVVVWFRQLYRVWRLGDHAGGAVMCTWAGGRGRVAWNVDDRDRVKRGSRRLLCGKSGLGMPEASYQVHA
jgi:hypothetical protein